MKDNTTYNSYRATFFVVSLVCCFVCKLFSQTTNTPKFQTFQPINAPHYTNSNLTNQNVNYSGQNVPMGSTAEDVINNVNKTTPGPVYKVGMSQSEMQQANNNYIAQQMANDPAYQMPNAQNGFQNPAFQKEKERLDLMNEINQINNKINKSGYYDSEAYNKDFANYQNGFQKLKDMLEGKTPLSITDALYYEESAYGNLHISYQEYKQTIAQSKDFMQKWMQQNNRNPNNPEAVHLTIQKFMGDELSIVIQNPDSKDIKPKKITHKPFMYDFDDYKAEKDLRNYFVTKTLATGTGQCHTLPCAYMVFAEAMGVDASITYVHQHSFIKYKNSKGTIENYEPTVDWHMSDNDYMEDVPVMAEAIKNKMYLQALTKKQMIASIMIELANNFHREHWTKDGKFLNECIDYAMKYFEKGEGNREGLLLKNLVLASQLDIALYKNKITDLKDVYKTEETAKLYEAFRKSSNKIDTLGIQDFPENVYYAMLERHDKGGKLQQAKKIDTKSKKSLFSIIETQ